MAKEYDFSKDKDCKGSVRYANTLETKVVFTIYVPRSELSNPPPNKINVKIEER